MKDYVACILIAAVVLIFSVVLKAGKEYLLAILEGLINTAEKAIEGSNLGPEKKRWVLEHFKAKSAVLQKWADKAIDEIVARLNATGNWFYNYGTGANTYDKG